MFLAAISWYRGRLCSNSGPADYSWKIFSSSDSKPSGSGRWRRLLRVANSEVTGACAGDSAGAGAGDATEPRRFVQDIFRLLRWGCNVSSICSSSKYSKSSVSSSSYTIVYSAGVVGVFPKWNSVTDPLNIVPLKLFRTSRPTCKEAQSKYYIISSPPQMCAIYKNNTVITFHTIVEPCNLFKASLDTLAICFCLKDLTFGSDAERDTESSSIIEFSSFFLPYENAIF